jgi:hypothetical protein
LSSAEEKEEAMTTPHILPVLFLVGVFGVEVAGGQELAQGEIPNWAAPATWSPARFPGGVTAMDVTNPLTFIGLAPCRIADTRNAAGPYGAPALSGGVPRNFTLTAQCGIPASAMAISLNVTVTNTAGPGFILIYPQGGSQPTVSTLNYVAGQTIANAAIVPLGTGGGATVIAGVSGTDLILDTNGYYYDGKFGGLAAGEQLTIVGTVDFGAAMVVANQSSQNGSSGIYAASGGSTGDTIGVFGLSFSTSGKAAGVSGLTMSTAPDAAGVFGTNFSGTYLKNSVTRQPVGVLGQSLTNIGVEGDSRSPGAGVRGELYNTDGTLSKVGLLAFSVYGVYSNGDFGGTGAKYFVEPHATDPSLVVRYVSLEGNESGTYFRGTANTVGGEAVIDVPEDFRMVTDSEGLTVQLTPVGRSASMFVVSEDLNQIVVHSSRDVKFHYQINGVRRAFKNFVPIAEGQEFMPYSPSAGPLSSYPAEIRQRLVANGTYNADGSINMETAERLGWAKAWRDREEQAKAAAAANATAHAARLAERK